MKFVKVSIPGPRGGLTLYVFLLRSCCVYPTWLGRRGTPRKQQQHQHDTVVQGPRAIIAPRAVRLILSGIPSLTIGPPKGDTREGDIPLKCRFSIFFEIYFIKNSYPVSVSRALVSNIEFCSKFRSHLSRPP